ncbi:MAG: bifunctional glutamate N-acetyltransferase/amino-acid acetyltransferase ArgJ, partial [Pseudomonadota bacterium]
MRVERDALDARIRALEGPHVSPLAPATFPDLPAVAGVEVATAATGLRYRGRDDVWLAALAPGTAVAGVFTRSATRSAPVLWCETLLARRHGAASTQPAAIIVNAGNANAFTGTNGAAATARVVEATAKALGQPALDVFVASTGVIGEPLEDEKIRAHLAAMTGALAPGGWEASAKAIMTTDTFAKGAGTIAEIDGTPVTIAGIAKGSGMIAPDMATMLVFLFTDAPIAPMVLQEVLAGLNATTFNAITVDGDTSTSDTLLLAATGQAAMTPITTAADPRLPAFRSGLETVMRDLALQVVRDGEGATKLVEITVTGAEDDAAAHRVGLAIANSPLVKTAIAGQDPNWGRIVMAVGKSGEKADRDRLTVTLGDMVLAEKGWRAAGY